MPTLDFKHFSERFNGLVSKYKITWEAVGFYSPDGRVYPFGTDTKVISTVFEALAGPIIKEIADEFGYIVEGSEQTVYPDFTLTPKRWKTRRVAVDIKTTYRRFNSKGEVAPFRYTLGSYTSFLRSPGAAKNIKYPYKEYSDHWVIGFLYTRRPGVAAKVYYKPEEISSLPCPYLEVEYFVQEKHKIVGYTPASGNTTNIGSFPTSNIDDLRKVVGPFAEYEKIVCDNYWRQFAARAADRAYSNIAEFLAWEKKIETAGGEN